MFVSNTHTHTHTHTHTPRTKALVLLHTCYSVSVFLHPHCQLKCKNFLFIIYLLGTGTLKSECGLEAILKVGVSVNGLSFAATQHTEVRL